MANFNDTLPVVRYESQGDGTMQPALFVRASGDAPRPLLVALHTWSADLTQSCEAYAKRCRANNWHFIYPLFRGPNWQPEACGSDLVVADILSAVEYVKKTVPVDTERVYLAGGSGGGHCTLLLAGRAPEVWSAVSAWCPISSVTDWHRDCKGTRHNCYAEHIERACGGDPAVHAGARKESEARSPRTYLANAAHLTVDISTGIHDGHTGSVPVGQSVRAFNLLAAPGDRISEEDIAFMETREEIPAHLKAAEGDPAFGTHTVLLRRLSNRVRLTIFEGGHDLLVGPAVEFLSRQTRGGKPDWRPGSITAIDRELDPQLGK